MDVFSLIADERRELSRMLRTLTPEQLQSPSLVPTWTVKDVAAHLLLALEVSTPRAIFELLLTRDFDKWADRLSWKMAKKPISEIADILERKAEKRFKPPRAGPEAPLTDNLVHGLDIRKALNIPRTIPPERSLLALRFLTETPARGFVKPHWLPGLRFEATDLDWSFGSGPLLRGHSDDLLLAMTGRRAALDSLQGDGIAELRRRFG